MNALTRRSSAHATLARLAGFLMLVFALSGCDSRSSETTPSRIHVSAGTPSSASTGNPVAADTDFNFVIDRVMNDSFTRVPFMGVRKVEFYAENGTTNAIFTERIWSDGTGNFGIDMDQALSALRPPEPLYRALKENSRGLDFYYAGFRVRHRTAFAQNWSVTPTGIGSLLSGRPTIQFEVRNTVRPDADYYLISVDELNGFVIREERFNLRDALLERRTYLTIDFNPDFTMAVPHTRIVNLENLDRHGNLDQQMGFKVRHPLYLPEGFRPFEVQRVTDSSMAVWNKLGYSDGIEVLFVLQREIVPTYPAAVADSQGQSSTFDGGPETRAISFRTDDSPGDEMFYDGSDSAAFAHGLIGDREFYVVGRLNETEAIDILQSTKH